MVYFQRLVAETDIDYLDLHIYPINRDYLIVRAGDAADLARRRGKGVIIGEAWLYKMLDRELGRPEFSWADVFCRDNFSFWAPLDARFIQHIGRWSRWKGVEWVSFFWAQYLFGYADYDPSFEAKLPAEVQQLGARAAVPNIVAKRPSPAGEALQRLIRASQPK
jgi:hypothetical protein